MMLRFAQSRFTVNCQILFKDNLLTNIVTEYYFIQILLVHTLIRESIYFIDMNTATLLAITMGDPASIGAEVALKALTSPTINAQRLFIIGEETILRTTAHNLGITSPINLIANPYDCKDTCINILPVPIPGVSPRMPATASKLGGKASFAYIEKAIQLALGKSIGGVVTGPLCKESLAMASIPFPGHTEIFAQYSSTKNYSMVFRLEGICVAHVTTHCALTEAIGQITTPRIQSHILLLENLLLDLGIKTPRIAVAGLNPHAGENGLFGDEEILHIIPAIKNTHTRSAVVTGPYPPDTVFMRAFSGEFDGVISMLHDHGFTALKSRDFKSGVNITAGLPFVRTSVGHGTAFDISGKNRAHPASMIEAIHMAQLLTKHT